MNTETPRTDKKIFEHPSGYEVVISELAYQLVLELNAARAEIERLDTAGIHSCHENCQRPNCVMRRELKAVTEQRDELLRYNEAFRNETLICADCDSISKEEYDRAIEQRDRLEKIAGELIAMIRMNVIGRTFEGCTIEQIDKHLKPWINEIAAVEGGDQ